MSPKYAFNALDYEIVRSYESMVEGLALMLGNHCEVVLHTLDNLECSAVCIANGELTGRQSAHPSPILPYRHYMNWMGEKAHRLEPALHAQKVAH